MNKKRVLVIGNTTVDHVFRVRARLARDSKLQSESYEVFPGGQAANVAFTLAFLGLEVLFVGAFGNDDGANLSREAFEAAGVDLQFSTNVGACPHHTAAVLVADDERTIIMYRDPRLKIDVNVIAEAAIGNCSAVYTDGHEWAASLRGASLGAATGIPFVADIEIVNETTRALARTADHLIAPVEIICELADQTDPERAVRALTETGPLAVVATMGARGSIGHERGENAITRVLATACNVVDTTGAGDAYHAGYLASLLRGDPFIDRMRFAGSLAAAKCAVTGPRLSAACCARFKS